MWGDELTIISEQYLPKNLPESFSGVALVDPYKHLMVDPYNATAPRATRYASWRAGEWDLWVLEKA